MAKLTPSAQSLSELVIAIFRVNGLALEAGDLLCRPAGLTSAQWQVLGVVDHGAASVANVARTMGLTRQSVQLTADAMERAGLVEYRDNPHHRRAKLIAIAAKGERALRVVEERQAAWATRLARKLGDSAGVRAAVEQVSRIGDAIQRDLETFEEQP
jgi:DNA-binding MarR family transcriptional regulator